MSFLIGGLLIWVAFSAAIFGMWMVMCGAAYVINQKISGRPHSDRPELRVVGAVSTRGRNSPPSAAPATRPSHKRGA